MPEGENGYKQPLTEVNPFETVHNSIRYIQTEREPINYSKIVTPETRVLAIGEAHTIAGHKQELAKILPQLRQSGFTHLAMEFWPSDMQEALDEFQSTDTGREKLEEYARKKQGRMGDEYVAVVEAAKKAGIRVMAIDISQNERKIYDSTKADEWDKREHTMVAGVKKALEENEQYKVITYTGGMHAAKGTSTMAALLVTDGYPVSSASLVSAIDEGRTNFEKALVQTGLRNERFMTPALKNYPKSTAKYDWMINIPNNNPTNSSHFSVAFC